MTPPRRPPPGLPTDDLGFDESALPPDQARKKAYREEEEAFVDSLQSAAAEDAGVGYYEELLYAREAAAFSYGGAASIAMGKGAPTAGRDGRVLDEEEYAEYVRAGMWRRKNKEEVERREALERERKVREEKESRENDKRRREEAARIKKLEERRRADADKEEKAARELYAERWTRLAAPAPTPNPPPSTDSDAPPPPTTRPLRFTDVPWPLYPPMPLPPLSWPSVALITPSALSTFLLSHIPSAQRKTTLRAAVLAYHPDRFERIVGRVEDARVKEGEEGNFDATRERVRELGLRVSQVLNELMKAGGGQ